MREKENPFHKITEAIDIFEDALHVLGARMAETSGAARRAHLELVKSRLDGLSFLARTGKRLLEAMLSGASVDASPLKRFDAGARE